MPDRGYFIVVLLAVYGAVVNEFCISLDCIANLGDQPIAIDSAIGVGETLASINGADTRHLPPFSALLVIR